MKIAIASSGLGHVNRGIESWAEGLSAGLAVRGMDVRLYMGGGNAKKPYEEVLPCWQRFSRKTSRLLKCLPRRFFWRYGFGGPYAVEQTTFAWNLVRALRRRPVDLVHVQDPQVAYIVNKAQKMGKIQGKTILGNGTEESMEFLSAFDFIQVFSPQLVKECKSAHVWKPTWELIPCSIDSSVFQPGRDSRYKVDLGIPPDGKIILSVAAIKTAHKRIDYLIQEFATLRELDPALPVHLVVAGSWEKDTDEILRRGKELLGDRVHFLVNFNRADVVRLYQNADLFVLASLNETFGLVLLEAMATGIPCVTNKGSVPEWVVGEGGVSTDMGKKGALANTCRDLLNNPGEVKALGKKAREACEARFSESAVTDQYVKYYERIISSSC